MRISTSKSDAMVLSQKRQNVIVELEKRFCPRWRSSSTSWLLFMRVGIMEQEFNQCRVPITADVAPICCFEKRAEPISEALDLPVNLCFLPSWLA